MAKSQKIELVGADLIKKALKRIQEDLEETLTASLLQGYVYGKPMPDLKDLSSGDTLFGLFSRDLRENLLTDIAVEYGNIPIDIVISDEDLISKHVIIVKILNDEAKEVLSITIPTATFIAEYVSRERYLTIAHKVIPAIAQLLEKEEDEDDIDE